MTHHKYRFQAPSNRFAKLSTYVKAIVPILVSLVVCRESILCFAFSSHGANYAQVYLYN